MKTLVSNGLYLIFNTEIVIYFLNGQIHYSYSLIITINYCVYWL